MNGKCPSVGEQIPRLDRRKQFASPGRNGVFFFVLGPLILSGVLALAIAVALIVLVALVQRLVVFCSGIFTTRRVVVKT